MSNSYVGYFQSSHGCGEDSLQARFTGWLKTLMWRARLRYIQKINRRVEVCSLDIVPESVAAYEDNYPGLYEDRKRLFDFEETRLVKAFSELPLMKREVLKLLYYDEMKPSEAAELLGCSLQHIYNQKSLALTILRQILSKDGDGK